MLLRFRRIGSLLTNSVDLPGICQSHRNLHKPKRSFPIKYPEKSLYPKKHLYDQETHKKFNKAMSFLKAKRRKGTGVFVENIKMVIDLINQGQKPSHIFYVEAEVLDKVSLPDADTEKIQITEKQMARLTDVAAPQGLMAVFSRPATTAPREDSIPLIIYLDQVKQPGNIGTIIRSAAGAACTSIITSPKSADVWSPATLRASAAAHFLIPLHEKMEFDNLLESLPENWKICLVESANSSESSIKSTPYNEVDLSQPTVMVFGGEADGLSAHIRDRAMKHGVHNVITTHIPIIPQLDSLNVGMAATVLIYEMARQQKHVSTLQEKNDSLEFNGTMMSSKCVEPTMSNLAEDLESLFPSQEDLLAPEG